MSPSSIDVDCRTGTGNDVALMAARTRLLLFGLAAGTAIAFSLPPWGFWPLGIAGFALFVAALRDQSRRGRLLVGTAVGTAMFGIGLFWITEFQAFGFVARLILEPSFVAAAAIITPPGRTGPFVLPAALVLAEAARGAVPFGGLPLGGAALGQAAGPLATATRVGGPLLLLGITVALGSALVELAARRWLAAAVLATIAVAAALIGAGDTGPPAGAPMRIAAVQGGGIRGLRAVESDPNAVYQRQLQASAEVQPPIDVVVWPEDVVDLDEELAASPERKEIGGLAVYLDTTLIAGVVEPAGLEHFRNAAVAFGPDGSIVDRYEKVHRVPFGEYIPLRGLIQHLASLALAPRDAIPGHGPGLLKTPAGPLGVVISYEVFFPDRARAAIRAGGDILLAPTNASSFRTSQVPTQEVAAARLRALETGRDVVQAAPTGYCAVIDSHGRVLSRSVLGRQEVLTGVVHRRHGRTPYLRWGDGPVLLLAIGIIGVCWFRARRFTD